MIYLSLIILAAFSHAGFWTERENKRQNLLKTARININTLINSNHLVIQLVDSKKMIDTPQMIFFF